MKAGNSKHFEQAYNAQAAVDTEGSMLILGRYVTNHANDKRELLPVSKSIDPEVRDVTDLCADTGYFSEEAVRTETVEPVFGVIKSVLGFRQSMQAPQSSCSSIRCSLG
ncbi:MAG: hypothetical protein B6241_10505 [Spirochaetaceae bacterium 4572_59]|nr:MAG: hypothetical protein B6241_10505 [Spirochaetaceae bacterium 4572_59]